MIEIEKYARAAASTARTTPNSPARHAALEAENASRIAAEEYVAGQAHRIDQLETKVDTIKRLHDAAVDERDAAHEVLRHIRHHANRMQAAIAEAQHKQVDGSKNCMQCAVAYMLDLPVEETPDFEMEHSPQRTAWERMDDVFAAHGCTVEMFPPTVEITGDYLASGTTERGTSHMVVMRGGKLLHDPHPSNAGLQSIQVVWLIARKAGPNAGFTGPRPAVRLTDEQIAGAFLSRCPAHLRSTHDVRDMQARPDVMEMGRAIETAVLAANGIGEQE